MKLVRFSKNKKQKRIIIGSILGILVIIGSIVLIRSYALYEEEKEFNVLKGQIPDFGYDIKMLSVVVDGEKSKSIPSRGLYKTQIDCSNGTRGEWDYNAWNLTLENVSENARCNITFTSNLSDEEYNQYIEAGKALRRNTYRGKDITSYHEDGSLYEMISSGRFDDIYVGDYIESTVDGKEIIWLIADIDNYLTNGDRNALRKHHVTLVPSKPISDAKMNDTDTTEGGYLESKMIKLILPSILEAYVSPFFGSHVITYRNLLTNEMDSTRISAGFGSNSGAASAWIWVDRQIDLLSEVNVYGTTVFSSSGFDVGIDSKQYALFQLKPELINCYEGQSFSYWTKNIVNSTNFAVVGAWGSSGQISNKGIRLGAANLWGVRPRILIG